MTEVAVDRFPATVQLVIVSEAIVFTHSVVELAIEYTAGLADLVALYLMAFPLLDLLPLLAGT